jgi:hypothetical protein
MKAISRLSIKIAALVVCLLWLAGCSINFKSAPTDYFFSNSLLNAQWEPTLCRHADGKAKVAKKKRRKKKRRSASKRSRKNKTVAKKNTAPSKKAAKKVAAKQKLEAPKLQPLRGNELKVVREEIALSAQRLVGIRNSFTQDTFARHLLTVNNLGLGKVPKTGVVAWLHKQTGAGKSKLVGPVGKGDLLFLGDNKPDMLIVAESVTADGVVTFVGYLDNEVKRGVLSTKHKSARRDESTQKILNSFVGKSRLAGDMLLGVSSLSDEGGWLAGQMR